MNIDPKFFDLNSVFQHLRGPLELRDAGAWEAQLAATDFSSVTHGQMIGLIEVCVKSDWVKGIEVLRAIQQGTPYQWLWENMDLTRQQQAPLVYAVQHACVGATKLLLDNSSQEFAYQAMLLALPSTKRPLRWSKARVKVLNALSDALMGAPFLMNDDVLRNRSHILLAAVLDTRHPEVVGHFIQQLGYGRAWEVIKQMAPMEDPPFTDRFKFQSPRMEQLWLTTPQEHLPSDVSEFLGRWSSHPQLAQLMPAVVAGIQHQTLTQAVGDVGLQRARKKL